MRDRLMELIDQKQVYGIDQYQPESHNTYLLDNDELADHLLANGVIVPPCKVNDTVWVNWERYKGKKETHPVKVYALRYDTKKNSMRICVDGKFEISAYGGDYTHYYNGTFAWNSVGKTVFLTREEAEKALAEREGKG